MADTHAYAIGAENLATIDWTMPDGRVAMLVRVAYSKVAPYPRPGDWAVCIAVVDISGSRAAPFEFRTLNGDPIVDINAVGFSSWQTVTRAPNVVLAAVEPWIVGIDGGVANWERR